MKVGVATETTTDEFRVGMTSAVVREPDDAPGHGAAPGERC